MEEHRQGIETTGLPCRWLQLSLMFSEMLKWARSCYPSGLLCECTTTSITITAQWQKMKFQKHFQKHNPPETKVGKILIPIFQYGSNGSERAGKWGWIKCLWGLGSHSAIERGCLTQHVVYVLGDVVMDVLGEPIQSKDHPGRAIAVLSKDILLLSCLWLTVNFIMNQFRVPNWSPEIPLLVVEVSLILVLVALGLSRFPCKATISFVTFRPCVTIQRSPFSLHALICWSALWLTTTWKIPPAPASSDVCPLCWARATLGSHRRWLQGKLFLSAACDKLLMNISF